MPNRIIKETISTSDKISSLTDFEFRLWVGLITYVDDAGRGDARPAIIKGRVFPLRERVSIKDIEAAVHGLAAKGCVSLYKVGGKPYLWFPTWGEHQRIRDVKPKYPGPEDADAPFDNLPQSAADCGELPPESESESNPNPNPNTKRVAGKTPARFTPPTVDEVREYCQERGNSVDPQRFVDYYEARGWMIKDVKMKSWKAAVRTWESNSNADKPAGRNGMTSAPRAKAGMEQSTRDDMDRMRRMLESMKEEQ